MRSKKKIAYAEELPKHDFAPTYNRRWPHRYFRAHLDLDYMIPDRAKPIFEATIARLKAVRNKTQIKIIDIGCSYGINAALLRSRLGLDDLYAAYTGPSGALTTREPDEHWMFFNRLGMRRDLSIIGVDPSVRAVRYGVDTALLAGGVARNLETEQLRDEDQALIEGADLIISTGCVGYATAETFQRVYEATRLSHPWVAAFAMHPYRYDDIASALGAFGLQTWELPHLRQRQRRFSTPGERTAILSAMRRLGMEDQLERTTSFIYASFHLSTPPEEAP